MSKYDPEVNDYVIWTNSLGQIHQGWVYFKGEQVNNEVRKKHGWNELTRYITIEIGTKPKPKCSYSKSADLNHKLIHSLLLCYEHEWCNLQFVKKRKSKNDDSLVLDSTSMYKSQEHRYGDLQ